MGADALQTALVSLLDDMTGYSAANVKRADWSVLNGGVSKAIVVGAGSVEYETEGTTFAGNFDTYDLLVNLLVAYTTDAAADSALAVETDRIVERLRKYPRLSGTASVIRAWVASAGRPDELFGEDGSGPHWWLREIVIRVWYQDDEAALE